MTWTARQQRMLAAMGIRLWLPAERRVERAEPVEAAVEVAEPVRAPAGAEAAVEVAERVRGPAGAQAVAEAVAVATFEAPAVPVSSPPTTVPVRPASTRPARPSTPAVAESAPAPLASTEGELAARAAAIAALAWTPLQEAVAACTACGLCASRRQTVFGVGHPRAEWMIVGEAPGEQEDLAGEPFVGPAGQLLDQMLRALGLSRADEPSTGREEQAAPRGPGDRPVDEQGDPMRRVFIANTLKCRPPRNRNPEPEELARCEPFLRRQVALVQPRVILLMGRFAVRTLLKSDEAIGRLRGRLHRYEGIPVIVTYHPAYLLRNLPDKARAWEDLCFAAETMANLREGGGVRPPA